MASHKSAKKRARQNLVRAERNRAARSRVKSAVRVFLEAVAGGKKDEAKTKLAEAERIIRNAASKGVMPKTTASRRVSRLTLAFNKASAAPQA